MFDSVAEVYQLISEARDVLMDEQKREDYNKKHKAMLARKSRREREGLEMGRNSMAV